MERGGRREKKSLVDLLKEGEGLCGAGVFEG